MEEEGDVGVGLKLCGRDVDCGVMVHKVVGEGVVGVGMVLEIGVV